MIIFSFWEYSAYVTNKSFILIPPYHFNNSTKYKFHATLIIAKNRWNRLIRRYNMMILVIVVRTIDSIQKWVYTE